MADVAMLRKVLDRIGSLPEGDNEWDQNTWLNWYEHLWTYDPGDTAEVTSRGLLSRGATTCGTTACFAGWMVLMFAPERTLISAEYGEILVSLPGENGGNERSIGQYAQELAGLDPSEAAHLFNAENTLSDLHRIVEGIAAQETGC